MSVIYINKENKSEYKNIISKGNLVVDFSADWCGPCKMFGPIFEATSEIVKDIQFVKIDVDAVPEAREDFSIQSIPSVVILKDGKEINRKMGFMIQNQFIKFIEDNM